MDHGPCPHAIPSTRRWIAAASLVVFLIVSLFATAHVGHACDCAERTHECDARHCAHDGQGRECSDEGRDPHDEQDSHDGDECSLCRVLALVPIVAALPPALPSPTTALAAHRPDPVAFVPAAVLRLGLARGPPTLSRR